MTRKETEELLQKYLAGLTSREEELRLRDLANAEDATPEWEALRLMLGPLPPLEELLPQEAADAEYRRKANGHSPWRWAAAACVATVAVGGWMASTHESHEAKDVAVLAEEDSLTKSIMQRGAHVRQMVMAIHEDDAQEEGF